MQLIIMQGCALCPFLGTDVRGDNTIASPLRIEHACTISDDRVIVASDDLASDAPTIAPRWCPMRLERVTVELDVRPDRTAN